MDKGNAINVTNKSYFLQMRVCSGDKWDDVVNVQTLKIARQYKFNFQSAKLDINYRIVLRTTTITNKIIK